MGSPEENDQLQRLRATEREVWNHLKEEALSKNLTRESMNTRPWSAHDLSEVGGGGVPPATPQTPLGART